MKILKLIFENINSLKGKWQIDFTDPAFDGNAIFAITGATGAGKTTILDAICLALYGETPRVKEFSDDKGNELMSIGATHTSSEVVFSVNGKIYRAFWSQRRARQKSDGKLQPVVRELAQLKHSNDENGKILEEKIRQVQAAIEKLLGMNKEQFTRSVMLAQGDFAAFLKSDAKNRGEILERITGTQIYADIGKAAYAKNKAMKAELEQLKAKKDDIKILSPDELTALQTALEQNKQAEQYTQTQLNQLKAQQALAKQYADNQAECAYWQQQHVQNQQAFDDFAPRQHALDLANAALLIAPNYQAYQQDTITLNNQQDILDNLQKNLPIAQQNHQHSLQAVKQLEQAYLTAKQAHETQKPMITQVRALDQNLALVWRDIKQTKQQYHDEQAKNQVLTDKINSCHAQLERITHEQNQLAAATLSADKLALLHDKNTQFPFDCQRIQNALASVQKDHQSLANIQQNLLDRVSQRKILMDHYRTNKTAVEDEQKKLSSLQNQLSQLLTLDLSEPINPNTVLSQHIAPLHETQNQLRVQKENLQKAQDWLSQQTPLYTELQTLDQQITKTTEQHGQLQQQIGELKTQFANADTLRQSLSESFELHKQILHMKTHFDRLHDGEPCPLCGATEHPYKNKPNHLDGSQAQLAEQKLIEQTKITEQLAEQIQRCEIDLTKIGEQLGHQQNLKQQTIEKLNNIGEQIDKLGQFTQTLNAQNIKVHLQDLDKQLDQIQQNINKSQLLLSQYQQQLHQVEQANSTLGNIVTQGNAKKDEIELLATQFAQLQTTLQTQIASLIELHQQLDCQAVADHFGITIKSQNPSYVIELYEFILNQLQTTLPDDPKQITGEMISSLRDLPPACFDDYLATLSQISHHLAKLSDEQNQLGTQKQQLQSQFDSQITLQQELKTQQDKLQDDISNLNKTLENLQNDADRQSQNRQAVFAGTDIDMHEKQLLDAIDIARQKTQDAEQFHQNNQVELNKIIAGIEHSNTTINALQQKQNQSWERFAQALSDSSFADETAFLTAQLPKDELDELTLTSQRLQQALQQATISLQNATQKQQQLSQDNPDINQLNTDDLAEQYALLQQQQNELHQKIGEINAKILHENQNQQQYQALLEKITNKEKESAIWLTLDSLIGSSEGHKYRNFVQGLTLDLVLHHANTALQKMNDRYLLIHDSARSEPLNIMVIDIHQGDSVRSSNNLSGGETFVISLALALGLSQINSQNIHIESLFLDEGFGTLDENALDLALSTLFELQQNGKNIGIISHVTSLKERIDTQIVLEKQAAGRSIMYGAGVTRL